MTPKTPIIKNTFNGWNKKEISWLCFVLYLLLLQALLAKVVL